MTIQAIIDLLKQSGVNSKAKVIKWLETDSVDELEELKRDIEAKIGSMGGGIKLSEIRPKKIAVLKPRQMWFGNCDGEDK